MMKKMNKKYVNRSTFRFIMCKCPVKYSVNLKNNLTKYYKDGHKIILLIRALGLG